MSQPIVNNNKPSIGFGYRTVVSKPMSVAATLVLADAQRKFIDPDYRKKEKSLGLIPNGAESVFGNFPDSHKNRNKYNKSTYTISPRADDLKITGTSSNTRTDYTKSHSGTGGYTSSLLLGKKIEAPAPPKSLAFVRNPIPQTEFRRYYDRGDLPIRLAHDSAAKSPIKWKIPCEKLDYHHYLPLFIDGIREKIDPYRFIAIQGVFDLLEVGGSKILPTIPQLIIPIKTALNTKDPEIIANALKVLQQLINSAPMVGQALVPYYRQLLPVFNLFKGKNLNLGDGIEYGQFKKLNIGDLIEETLELLEQKGGEDAFVNIKYMIPTYESCILS